MSKTSRRSFMKTTAAVAALAGAGANRLIAKPLALPVGLQLYSVRELLPTDFDGTLDKLRAAGYTEVEPAGAFWEAEAEHQDYLGLFPNGYTCHFPRPGWKLPKRTA